MPDGAAPPWIMAMQRHGPPPSYPNLRIPGINIQLPYDATLFKDENGFLVYADCHALQEKVYQKRVEKKTYWGELAD